MTLEVKELNNPFNSNNETCQKVAQAKQEITHHDHAINVKSNLTLMNKSPVAFYYL